MKLLITGAGGMLGHAVLATLRRHKTYDVIPVLGREQVDLESECDTRALFRFVRPDLVIHLAAAVFGLGGNLKFPGEIYKRNIFINTNIVDASRNFGVRKLVVAGTTAIYSDIAPQPFREEDCLLGEPHHSEYAYATAKRAMLVQLNSYKEQYGMDFAYAVPTNMYGPHDRFDTEVGHVVPSLISKFLNSAASGGTVDVWGDGTPTRDFLYSYDAAAALILLLEKGSGLFNVASGTSHSIKELVETLQGLLPGVNVSWDKSKPLGQRRRSYNIEKLRRLGFDPQYQLAEGLRQTVAWCTSQNSDPSSANKVL
jgi:GDP-L-fucose synthase